MNNFPCYYLKKYINCYAPNSNCLPPRVMTRRFERSDTHIPIGLKVLMEVVTVLVLVAAAVIYFFCLLPHNLLHHHPW